MKSSAESVNHPNCLAKATTRLSGIVRLSLVQEIIRALIIQYCFCRSHSHSAYLLGVENFSPFYQEPLTHRINQLLLPAPPAHKGENASVLSQKGFKIWQFVLTESQPICTFTSEGTDQFSNVPILRQKSFEDALVAESHPHLLLQR